MPASLRTPNAQREGTFGASAGTIAGRGEGIAMTTTGEGATFQGIGVGRFTRPGATTRRGALCCEASGPSLSRLNGIAVLFEYEVDESGKSDGKLYEWT